jgi:hypothetical protein
MNRFRLTLVRPEQKDQYRDLILQSYAKAPNFKINPKVAEWTNMEEIYFPLGVFEGGRLVSCMRLEHAEDLRNLEIRVQKKLNPSQTYLPAAYLNKAGTLPEFLNQGFNSLLRWACLKICVRWKVKTVFGTMMEQSPRVPSMKAMGYEFENADRTWSGDYVSNGLPVVAHLDMALKGAQAVDFLEKNCASLIVKTDWDPILDRILPYKPTEVAAILKRGLAQNSPRKN